MSEPHIKLNEEQWRQVLEVLGGELPVIPGMSREDVGRAFFEQIHELRASEARFTANRAMYSHHAEQLEAVFVAAGKPAPARDMLLKELHGFNEFGATPEEVIKQAKIHLAPDGGGPEGFRRGIAEVVATKRGVPVAIVLDHMSELEAVNASRTRPISSTPHETVHTEEHGTGHSAPHVESEQRGRTTARSGLDALKDQPLPEGTRTAANRQPLIHTEGHVPYQPQPDIVTRPPGGRVRVRAARDFAKEFGIDAEKLLLGGLSQKDGVAHSVVSLSIEKMNSAQAEFLVERLREALPQGVSVVLGHKSNIAIEGVGQGEAALQAVADALVGTKTKRIGEEIVHGKYGIFTEHADTFRTLVPKVEQLLEQERPAVLPFLHIPTTVQNAAKAEHGGMVGKVMAGVGIVGGAYALYANLAPKAAATAAKQGFADAQTQVGVINGPAKTAQNWVQQTSAEKPAMAEVASPPR